MGRIRTVKPEFPRHEGLYELEKKTGFPLRLIYLGLWMVADREGRFRWKPRILKLDVLPFDEIDFSAALDALEAAGFIQRYQVNGEVYGWIPTFLKHQRPNVHEAASQIPEPPPQRKGMIVGNDSRKGKVPSEDLKQSARASTCMHMHNNTDSAKNNGLFDRFWDAYPRHSPSRFKAEQAFNRIHPSAETLEAMLSCIKQSKQSEQWGNKTLIPHSTTWLNGRYWEGDPPPAAIDVSPTAVLDKMIAEGEDIHHG
jgi:hypothetical protein